MSGATSVPSASAATPRKEYPLPLLYKDLEDQLLERLTECERTHSDLRAYDPARREHVGWLLWRHSKRCLVKLAVRLARSEHRMQKQLRVSDNLRAEAKRQARVARLAQAHAQRLARELLDARRLLAELEAAATTSPSPKARGPAQTPPNREESQEPAKSEDGGSFLAGILVS